MSVHTRTLNFLHRPLLYLWAKECKVCVPKAKANLVAKFENCNLRFGKYFKESKHCSMTDALLYRIAYCIQVLDPAHVLDISFMQVVI